MSYTYTSFTNQFANMLATSSTDPSFVTMLPGAIDDAEQRLYRELQLLNTVQTDTGTLTTNNRTFALPTAVGIFLEIETINVVTPSSTTNPDLGTRNALTPVSRDYLDFSWPSSTGATVPTYYAMVNQGNIVVGPWPDAGYTVEVVGTQRPAPLSASKTTTILTLYFPDLFMAAAMVYGAAFQKNFGASSDDPRMSQSWEAHYNALIKSAMTEETRKKINTGPWTLPPPMPVQIPKQ